MGRKMTKKEKREMDKAIDTTIKIIFFPITLPYWIYKQATKKRRKKKLF